MARELERLAAPMTDAEHRAIGTISAVPETVRQSEHVDALDRDWIVTYALEERSGATIITGIRITPRADAVREWPPTPGTAPDGGLADRRHLRRVKTGWSVHRLTHPPPGLDPSGPGLRDHLENSQLVRNQASGSGSASVRSDLHYLAVVVAYLEAIQAGSKHPVIDAAERTGYSRRYTRDLIGGARKRGLLTRASPGRPGGQLTAKARRVLEEDGGDLAQPSGKD